MRLVKNISAKTSTQTIQKIAQKDFMQLIGMAYLMRIDMIKMFMSAMYQAKALSITNLKDAMKK
jgi:hypothetical protein